MTAGGVVSGNALRRSIPRGGGGTRRGIISSARMLPSGPAVDELHLFADAAEARRPGNC